MATVQYIGGIFLALAATVLFNLSPVIQKTALRGMQTVSFTRPLAAMKMFFGNRLWVLGLAVGIVGAAPYIVAILWTGPAVVQPLISFGFIVLIVAAGRMLDEKLSCSAIGAIALMSLMPLFIYFSSVSNIDPSTAGGEGRQALTVFTIAVLVIAGSLWAFTARFPLFIAPVTGLIFSLGAIHLTAALAFLGSPEIAGLIPASVAGSLFVLFNLAAIFTLQMGLQKVAASRFIPISQTINNLATVTGGLAVFGQRAGNWWFYFAGIAFAVAGAVIMGRLKIYGEDAERGSAQTGAV